MKKKIRAGDEIKDIYDRMLDGSKDWPPWIICDGIYHERGKFDSRKCSCQLCKSFMRLNAS